MKLTVISTLGFRVLKKIFLDSDTNAPKFILKGHSSAPLEVYEANLDPMLRFFHLRDIKPCGWVTTESEAIGDADDSTITLAPEWDEIGPSAPGAFPAATAPFKMAAWDIECYSESGEFPVPEKGYDRLSKQLVALGGTAEDAIRRIVDAAVYPDAAPRGIDPLRSRSVLSRTALETALEKVRADFEGVFEAFPKLRLVAIEAGLGWVPALGWRLDELWQRFRDELPAVRRPPSETLRERLWYTTQPADEPEDPKHLRDVFDWIGWDRICFASDYPHWDSDDPRYALPIAMSRAEHRAIFRDNALGVYRLS
jgi:nitroreductase